MEEIEMANSEAYENGQQVRREMMGDELVELANTVYADPTEEVRRLRDKAVFGLLWTREASITRHAL